MRKYSCIRIFDKLERPTYGDKYANIITDKEYGYNDVIAANGEKYIVLFEIED